MTSPMTVDVWSDVVCPWCCIGRAQLERALEQFEHRHDIVVTWRSFELDPSSPAVQEASLAEQLAAKFGASPEEVDGMFAGVRDRAALLGLDLRFDIARSGNTFDAHRLLHLARQTGDQDALKGRFFRAYFTEGEPIGDPATLARLAVEVGLDPAAVDDVLSTDRFAADVRADEEEARALQISGVPFYVIDDRYGVAGAQPVEHLLAALRQAWSERSIDASV